MAASGQADRDLHHRRAGKMDPVASTIQFPGNRVLAIVRASDVKVPLCLDGNSPEQHSISCRRSTQNGPPLRFQAG